MFKKSTKIIALFLIANISISQCFSLPKFNLSKKKDFIYKRILSSKTVKDIIVATTISSIVYAIVLLRFKLLESEFEDCPDDLQKKIQSIAKKMNIKNPEKIKLKNSSKKSEEKSFMRKIFKILLFVPILRQSIFRCYACTGPMGNIYFNVKKFKEFSEDEKNFVLGHELSHKKHKDSFFGFIGSIAINLAFQRFFPSRITGIIPRSIKGIALASIINPRAIFAQTIGKFFEIRSDIESASISKEQAEGGVTGFKRFLPIEKKWYEYLELNYLKAIKNFLKILKDPHPSLWIRIKYLELYKRWKYGEDARA